MLFTDQAGAAEFEAELADVSRQINQLEYRRLFLLRKLELARLDGRDGPRRATIHFAIAITGRYR